MSVDLAVVGGGPAGLAVAIEARMRGMSAVVFERRDGPVDKACGEGLQPAALERLRRWGVDPVGAPIAGFSYSDGSRRVEHRFRRGVGRGVQRTTLSRLLRDRAVALGVDLRTVRVATYDDAGGHVRVGDVRARVLVAADGLHSAIRDKAGLARVARGASRYGVRRHFRVAPWSDLVEVTWLGAGELYVTPVGPETVGIALLGAAPLDLATSIAGAPELAARLRDAEPLDTVRGAGPLRQLTAGPVAGRVALVGDAAGYIDALTGEGMAAAFEAAIALVDAVEGDDLGAYRRALSRQGRVSRGITAATAALAASPLRRGIVPMASAAPWLFGAAVERLAAGA